MILRHSFSGILIEPKPFVMKHVKLIGLFILTFNAMLFASCKKDYTCTCTTTVGSVSTTKVYDLRNQRPHDANDACERFEDDLNNGNLGTTNCHL